MATVFSCSSVYYIEDKIAVPVISIGAAYILIKRKYIIDERKYEELVAEIKSTNKK